MKGRIPSNINIDLLVRDLRGINGKDLRIDTKQKLKDGMVYFLTLLTFDIDRDKKRKNGYKLLNNKILEEIIGTRLPTRISEILQQHNIIEILPHDYERHSTGYRFTQKYCTNNFKYIDYSDLITNKIQQHQNLFKVKIEDGEKFKIKIYDVPEYPYLDEQFSKNQLKIRTYDSYQNLRDLISQLINKTKRKRNYKTETCVTLLNLIGGYKGKLEKLKNKVYSPHLSPTNCRYYSTIVGLKKELRQFVQVNGHSLVEVDIKSSQPFILSTILNHDFTSSTKNGYNVFTIYPELYDFFQSVKTFVPSNKGETEFVLGVKFSPEDLKNLQTFIGYNFKDDFYNHILTNGYLNSNKNITQNEKVKKMTRDDVKRVIMNYLFDRNENNKHNNLIIEMINNLYPELWKFISRFIVVYNQTTFSYLLQRTESYLVLDKTCGYIHQNHPYIPFFTVHDSVLTTIEYSEQVKKIMVDIITETTGKSPVVSIKENTNNIDFKETWKKVNITTEKKFDKRKYTITQTNILKGLSLINDPQMKSVVKVIIEPYMKNYR